MKNSALIVLCLAAAASAFTASKFTQEQEQARLFRFEPVKEKEINAKLSDRDLLMQIARDTWGYFEDIADSQTGLPLDNIVIFSTHAKVNSYTSTTNIGLYLMSMAAGERLGFITREQAVQRIRLVLNTLEKLETWQGQPFNYYETITLHHSDSFVSSVDNGWLAAGLIVVRQAYYKDIGPQADALFKRLDFSKLYDPKIGQLYLGYDAKKGKYSDYHYGLFVTEPRVASYVGIAKGNLPVEHWYKIYRTIPAQWDWQRQKPSGTDRFYRGHKVFSGYYTHEGKKFVPSWGGSLFEFLMPTLVLNERDLSPKGLGLNSKLAVQVHAEYAKKMKYKVWGMSPCSTPEDPMGYKEYGVPFLGTKGYDDHAVVTPHVSFLALDAEPELAIKNIRKLLTYPGIYGGYGFYDSVNVKTGQVSPRYLSLDQGMSLIALANHLKDDCIKKLFHSHSWIKAKEHLLTEEVFF